MHLLPPIRTSHHQFLLISCSLFRQSLNSTWPCQVLALQRSRRGDCPGDSISCILTHWVLNQPKPDPWGSIAFVQFGKSSLFMPKDTCKSSQNQNQTWTLPVIGTILLKMITYIHVLVEASIKGNWNSLPRHARTSQKKDREKSQTKVKRKSLI